MSPIVPQPSIVNQKKVRKLQVSWKKPIGDSMVRLTLSGADLDGFNASGPSDHVRLFFPDPTTGELLLPQVGRQAGLRLGVTAVTPVRDYTPLNYQAQQRTLDIDFVLHGDTGPAARWAAHAKEGDQLGMGGPGRSQPAPLGITSAVLGGDETALPALVRWLDALGSVPTTVLLSVADPSLEGYFEQWRLPPTKERKFHWFYGEERETAREDFLRTLPFDDGTFAYLAGEATTIIPLRRYLRRELQLPKEQVQAEGFWKRGVSMLDHHAPLDPSDPD